MEGVNQVRKERIGEIIERAHSQLQWVLTEAGIGSETARRIAATRLFYVLPMPIRSVMAEAETAIVERLALLFSEVEQAEREEDVKGVPLE